MPLFPVSPIVLDIVTPVTSHHLSADFSKHRRPSLELLGVILNSYIVISRAVFSIHSRIRMPWCYSLSYEELLLSACTEFEKPLQAQRERVGNEQKYRKRIDITDLFLSRSFGDAKFYYAWFLSLLFEVTSYACNKEVLRKYFVEIVNKRPHLFR